MFAGSEWLIIGLMLAVTAVFAAYEMAIASVSRSRIAVLVARKRKGAEEAAYMKDRMEASLAVVQVGMTLAGAIAAATGGSGVASSLEPYLRSQFGLSDALAKVGALVLLIVPYSAFTIV